LSTGAKYALAVGAAAATVGIVIGVVTLTGVGFKLSYHHHRRGAGHGRRLWAAWCRQAGRARKSLTLLWRW
jgi:hypothetical protein